MHTAFHARFFARSRAALMATLANLAALVLAFSLAGCQPPLVNPTASAYSAETSADAEILPSVGKSSETGQLAANEVTVYTSAWYVQGVQGKFIGTATPNAVVSAKVDGYALTFTGGATSVTAGADGKYAFSYTFGSAKNGRKLEVTANANGTSSLATKTIDVKASGSAPAADPVYPETVTLVVPANVVINSAFTYTGTASAGVATVSASIDGFVISSAQNIPITGGAYSFSATFNTARTGRMMVVTAYNASGAVVATASKTFDVGDPNVISGVPYFCQLDNSIDPCCTCQNTCAAMVLKYYGASTITPDILTARWTRKKGQTVAGLAELINTEAAERGLTARDDGQMYRTVQDLQNHLKTGNPCIVHGWFTPSGHLMVVLGYDGTNYTVNDPYGQWNQKVLGSYTTTGGTIGRGIKYPKAAFEAAIIDDDSGVWLHRMSRSAN
jgi:hypothetical protein